MVDAAGMVNNYVAFIDVVFTASAAPGRTGYEEHAAAQKRHLELLAKYQVRADAMTTFLLQDVTESEVALLNPLSPRGLIAFRDLKNAATEAAQDRYPTGLADGHGDAFRHVYRSARMTQLFGEQWASEYTTAHERNPAGNSIPVAMDLHNNEVGR